MKPHIVIPTNRDTHTFEIFLKAWQYELEGCKLIVVEDRQTKTLTDVVSQYVKDFVIYDWTDIDTDLKDKSWVIPRRTDCVRSYGYYKAWANNPLFIVTLDDDVEPQQDHIQTFYKVLFQDSYPSKYFFNTLKSGKLPRGTYNEIIGCDVAHGGWTNVPDLSAEEQIKAPFISTKDKFNEGTIPVGSYFSMCGMNLAWKPHVTKDMYFGLQGGDYPIDRCGDIWAGYHIAQKGYLVHSGQPFCRHTRKSNIWGNLEKEANAERLSQAILKGTLPYEVPEYAQRLYDARQIWEQLFDEVEKNDKGLEHG